MAPRLSGTLKIASSSRAMDRDLLCELMHPSGGNPGVPHSIAYAILKPETVSKPHTLRVASEVRFVLEGKGIVHTEGETSRVGPGQAVVIPPGCEQYAEAMGTEDFKSLHIVYPFRREDNKICRGSG